MISLADLQQRIEQGSLSPDAAIAQSQDAIRAHDKTIGAFVCTDETARAQDSGPLRRISRQRWVQRSTADIVRVPTHRS